MLLLKQLVLNLYLIMKNKLSLFLIVAVVFQSYGHTPILSQRLSSVFPSGTFSTKTSVVNFSNNEVLAQGLFSNSVSKPLRLVKVPQLFAIAQPTAGPVIKEFYIQNTLRTGKTIRIPSRKILIQVDETKKNGKHLSRLNNVECLLDSILSDSIKVTLLSEEIDEDFTDRFLNQTMTYYSGSLSDPQKKFAIKDLNFIQMKSPGRTVLSKIGSVLMGGGILLIVASPLAGLSLKSDARASARTSVFTTGLACIGVSLPLFIFGKNKKYALSSRFETGKRNYWKLQQR